MARILLLLGLLLVVSPPDFAITSLVDGSSQAAAGRSAAAEAYDLLIRNGRVLDGTGNPWFPADVAVREGRIVAVGRLGNAQATTTIEAAGKYVSPGFIDIHSHADDGSSPEGGLRDANRARRAAPNLVSQGITTVVVNQDGRSPWPIRDQRALLESRGSASTPCCSSATEPSGGW